MSGVKQVARGMILVATALWFALAVNTAWAAGKVEHAATEKAGHAAAVETVEKVDGHAPAADAHAAPAVDAHAADPHAADPHAADAHGEGDGHGDGHHVSNSLSAEKLKELFWRLVNFAALMIILVKFGAKPIASALSGRQQQIKDEIEGLEARRSAAEASFDEFEEKLEGVEQEIDTIVEKAIAQAEVEKAKILEKAEQAADDIKRQAEQMIQNEVTEARKVLKDDVAEQAAAMAEELIKKNLTSDDQVKIIEDYLDKVGAVQ